MISVTIKNGPVRNLTTEVSEGTTAGDVLANAGFQAALGYSDSDRVMVNGYAENASYQLRSGDVVSFEKAACSKA